MDKETIEDKTYRLFTKAAVDVGIRLEAIPPIHMCKGTPSFVVLADVLALGIAEEREACAVIAEGQGHYMCEDAQDTAKNIAELIRARSNL